MHPQTLSILALSLGLLSHSLASAGGDKVDERALLSTKEIRITPVAPTPELDHEDSLMLVDETSRLGYISRARLWVPMNLDDLDARAGRQVKHKILPNDSIVECTFIPPPATGLGGTTNKFKCDLTKATDANGNDIDIAHMKLKVRYDNVKTYSDVITTRLAWVLGFGSDIETPVRRVVCHGCTKDPFHQKEALSGATQTFTQVSLEKHMSAVGIAVKGAHYSMEKKGETTAAWYWNELDYVNEGYGRATRAQVDALKLFAVFLEHSDSKAIQNRLLCLQLKSGEAGVVCDDPYIYVHDFGNTLGSDGMKIHPLDLKKWESAPIWKEGEGGCVAKLHMIFHDGSGLSDPRISEAGRSFLAERLSDLLKHEAMLHDIFDAAHIDEYNDHGTHYTAADWVRVFKARANQIINHSCQQ
jgi:hypothetical protein